MNSNLRVQRIDTIVGRNIGALRQENGVSITDLADFLDISVETLEGIENGSIRAPAPVLMTIVSHLRSSLADIFVQNTCLDQAKGMSEAAN